MVQDIKTEQATVLTNAPTTQQAEVITQQPIIKTINEAPVVEKIIEKQDTEIHRRDIVQEIHEQPIIEIERQQQTQYIEQKPIENVVVQPTKYEEVGTRMQQMPMQQQQNVVPTVESNVVEQRELPPIVETIIERPVYKQVIIEQHQIPVHTVYTTGEQPLQAQDLQQGNQFNVTQMQTALNNIQQPVQQPIQQPMQETVVQQPMQEGLHQQDHIRVVRTGYKKTVWGLSFAGELYQMTKDKKLGIMWEKFGYWENSGPMRFHDFSVIKKGYLYLIGLEDRQLYYLDPFNRHEGMLKPVFQNTTTLPRLKSVSAYGLNHAYLLAENGSIYLFDSGRILNVNGILTSLSCGEPGRSLFAKHGFEMWGVGQDGMAMRWNGLDSWLNMGLPVRDISVGRDNSVYAIGVDGQLLKWNHSANIFEQCRTKFSDLGGSAPVHFESVSVFKERNGVYCVDRHGNVYSMDL